MAKSIRRPGNPIHFRLGERLRWTFVNDTMMEHTMHLHGMWMHLENGAGEYLPRKHTVLVKPARARLRRHYSRRTRTDGRFIVI